MSGIELAESLLKGQTRLAQSTSFLLWWRTGVAQAAGQAIKEKYDSMYRRYSTRLYYGVEIEKLQRKFNRIQAHLTIL